jgi:allantoicase
MVARDNPCWQVFFAHTASATMKRRNDTMQKIPLFVVSYTDSGFTRVHDVVSLEEKKDHRGTFSHVGVRMEGLESRRHLNFKV